MTHREWNQLRVLMRKAEAGGKVNGLLTVHWKEVIHASMNKSYPPEQECEEGFVMHVNTTEVARSFQWSNDDPWIEKVDRNEKPKDKPVIHLFGNVVQQNADLAETKVAEPRPQAIPQMCTHLGRAIRSVCLDSEDGLGSYFFVFDTGDSPLPFRAY